MNFSSRHLKNLAVIFSAGLLIVITACTAIQPTPGPASPSPSTEPIQTEANPEVKPSLTDKSPDNFEVFQ